jgi:type I restriction enzyme M protein
MSKARKVSRKPIPGQDSRNVSTEDIAYNPDDDSMGDGDEAIAPDTIVCALTEQLRIDRPEERVLQNFVEQLHREYRVELADMERDVRVPCQEAHGKKKSLTVGIAVFEHGKPHHVENIIRVVLIAKSNTKVSDAAVGKLDLVLSNLSEDRPEVYGAWTNGKDLTFRMRTYDPANGFSVNRPGIRGGSNS